MPPTKTPCSTQSCLKLPEWRKTDFFKTLLAVSIVCGLQQIVIFFYYNDFFLLLWLRFIESFIFTVEIDCVFCYPWSGSSPRSSQSIQGEELVSFPLSLSPQAAEVKGNISSAILTLLEILMIEDSPDFPT